MAKASKSGKYVYSFGGKKSDGDGSMKPLLGGKGANLAEMSRIGLPVPPGFTITTEVCTYYYANKRTYPKVLDAQAKAGIAVIEKIMGLKFGDKNAMPLLVSVRSGARDSMPGIESRAPERTDTSNGIAFLSPNFTPMIFSMAAIPALACASSTLG
jgi:pyruvate,orthophosphate dikinase